MVWRRHTWQMCAFRSRLSSAGGSCGRQTAGHSSCRAQGPRSVGGTLPWLARPLGTASPSTCGLHHCPEIHLRKKLKTHLFEVFSNWALYKLTYSFIQAVRSAHPSNSPPLVFLLIFPFPHSKMSYLHYRQRVEQCS